MQKFCLKFEQLTVGLKIRFEVCRLRFAVNVNPKVTFNSCNKPSFSVILYRVTYYNNFVFLLYREKQPYSIEEDEDFVDDFVYSVSNPPSPVLNNRRESSNSGSSVVSDPVAKSDMTGQTNSEGTYCMYIKAHFPLQSLCSRGRSDRF